MAYLGNLNGPRESQIVDLLGYDFFGITPSQLEYDIEMWEESERRNEIQPIHVDENGQPYILLSGPQKIPIRFFLEEHGYFLKGLIQTFTKEETESWRCRFFLRK